MEPVAYTPNVFLTFCSYQGHEKRFSDGGGGRRRRLRPGLRHLLPQDFRRGPSLRPCLKSAPKMEPYVN